MIYLASSEARNTAGAPLLTSIVSEDDIYADFEVDEQPY